MRWENLVLFYSHWFLCKEVPPLFFENVDNRYLFFKKNYSNVCWYECVLLSQT